MLEAAKLLIRASLSRDDEADEKKAACQPLWEIRLFVRPQDTGCGPVLALDVGKDNINRLW